jgi:hypothetical protein
MILPQGPSFSYLALFLLFIFLEALKRSTSYFIFEQMILSTFTNNFLID